MEAWLGLVWDFEPWFLRVGGKPNFPTGLQTRRQLIWGTRSVRMEVLSWVSVSKQMAADLFRPKDRTVGLHVNLSNGDTQASHRVFGVCRNQTASVPS